jgi:hypothetical protein
MHHAYYSIVLEHEADRVWTTIREFGQFQWSGVRATILERKELGGAVGSVRQIQVAERQVGQRLVAHSDDHRSYTYELCEPNSLQLNNFRSTIGVCPVVESGTAFVQWSASFECAAEGKHGWTTYFETGFAKSLISLRRFMAVRNAERLLHGPVAGDGRTPRAYGTNRGILRLVSDRETVADP